MAYGFRPQTATVSYFVGNDESKHQRNVSTYERVNLGDIYPGNNVQVRATGNNIEKIFTVAPKQDPKQIQVKLSGATKLEVNDQGELIAHTGNGPVSYTAPIAYQEDAQGNKEPIAVAYAINSDTGSYGFTLSAYDLNRSLIIDPLIKSTYLGAAGDDGAPALAIHPATGEVYVAGYTNSATASFPGVIGGAKGTNGGGGTDALVSRFFADLTAIDTTPNVFALASQSNVPVASLRTSNPVQLSSMVGAATIYVDGAFGSRYCVSSGNNCSCDVSGSFVTTPGTVANNQYVCVRHSAAAVPNVVTQTNLHVGGVVGRFFVSTGTTLASCNLDMDGDTQVSSTKEWLVLLRASLGFTGTATTAGTSINAAQWIAARPLINANCGTNFGP